MAHSGLVRVPPRISSTRRQPAQRARRFWQALHHGRLVAWEISQYALRPQIAQITWLLAGAGDAGSLGSQLADSRRAAGGLGGPGSPAGERDGFDQLGHRAAEDVQQR